MSKEKLILTSKFDDYNPIYFGNIPVFEKYSVIINFINENLGEEYSNIYTKPVVRYDATLKRKVIDFYSTNLENPKSFFSLNKDEQIKKLDFIKLKIDKIIDFAKKNAKDENNTVKEYSKLILYSLEIPDLQYIFVDDTKFVITLWGFVKENSPTNEEPKLSILIKAAIKNNEQITINQNKTNDKEIKNDNKESTKNDDKIVLEKLLNNVLNQESNETDISNKITQHIAGLIFDDDNYKNVKLKKVSKEKLYESLTENFSLKPYCPTPASQGKYGTCVAWACAYGAATIVEAVEKKLKDNIIEINKLAYSPHFVYKLIKKENDTNCSEGTLISNALNLLKDKGVPHLSNFDTQCAKSIPANIFSLAKKRKIKSFVRLFEVNDTEEMKNKKVKKAISNLNPVVIGMQVYKSFDHAKEVWNGAADSAEEGHAMLVIGWNNQKYGGAFEIMNSWGTNWGNGGFIWIKYSDFAKYTKYAFEINGVEKPDNKVNLINEPPKKCWLERLIEKIKNLFS